MNEDRASPSGLPTWLFVLPWSPTAVGGVNQVVLSLVREMRLSGEFKPLVLEIDWSSPHPQVRMPQNETAPEIVRWRVRPQPSPGSSLKVRLAYWLWSISFRRRFEAFCKQHRVAVINPHYCGSASLTLQHINARFTRPLPLLFSFHGADLTTVQASPTEVGRWRQALSLPNTMAIACSQALARGLKDTFGPSSRCAAIHNGVDMAALLSDTPPPAPQERRTVLTVGKFEAKKGQSTLLKAFAQVKDRFADVDLLLIGAEDAELPRLRALAEELSLAPRIRFLVNVPHRDIGQHFSTAQLFVLPSLQEPFGLVVLEAATFQLPVLASRVGGIPEMITEGKTGVLVEPGNADALAEGLARLLSDPEGAATLARQLHEEARERFSWRNTWLGYQGQWAAMAPRPSTAPAAAS